MATHYKSSSHAVFLIRLHVVFVTKYRKKCITPDIGADLKEALSGVLGAWRCSLIEFGHDEDHVHLLIDIHPALNISALINNLKSASSKRIRGKHGNWLRHFYAKNLFWNRAYFVSSVGGPTLETVRAYVEAQGKGDAVKQS